MLFDYDTQAYRTNLGRAYIAKDKGRFKGSCNRSDCQAPHSAYWYNNCTRKFYCFSCAHLINTANPREVMECDLMRIGCKSKLICIPWSSEHHPRHEENACDQENIRNSLDNLVLNGWSKNIVAAFRTLDTDAVRGTITRLLKRVEKVTLSETDEHYIEGYAIGLLLWTINEGATTKVPLHSLDKIKENSILPVTANASGETRLYNADKVNRITKEARAWVHRSIKALENGDKS